MNLVTVTGTLKGYDQLLNLVLDEAVEFLRGMLHSILETVYGFVELFICTNVYHPCTQELSIYSFRKQGSVPGSFINLR